ncbi:hypothetical protein K2Z84_05360 [Candidatus Binatia bacterium]|nr:hypothetical protein [Candidatus Binatia bacterium]
MGLRKFVLVLLALAVALYVGTGDALAVKADLKTGTSLSSATSTAVVPANSRRIKLTILNLAATNPMTCTTLGTATATNGFVIPASGSKVFDTKAEAKRAFKCFSTSGTTAGYDEVVDDDFALTAPTPTPIATPTPTPIATPTPTPTP